MPGLAGGRDVIRQLYPRHRTARVHVNESRTTPVTDGTENRPPVSFWLISIVLLLWGVGGASIYVAYFVETPEEFARTAEIEANWEAYTEYIANIPFWAIAAGIAAAVTRLLGAIGLLLRRVWVLPLYIVSTVCLLAALFRAFVLANVATVMSGPHIATEVVFITLSVFAIWFARENKSRGILR